MDLFDYVWQHSKSHVYLARLIDILIVSQAILFGINGTSAQRQYPNIIATNLATLGLP